ncbi:growth factor receptor-bound protein 14 isoform X3 [Halyomorpha halys]|uniref:growth factor receptor-bound protein 14 isoform X3 n=1 Tax=Halyomorpha halys TaxID=286706 RepID=UPI0006D4ED4F|nr:growth factor receptor-bound protein 14-like isoform X2 [Halyomorpha halys]
MLQVVTVSDRTSSKIRCACFKGMRLRCLDAGGGDSYIRLDADKDDKQDKQEELQFYNDDGSFQSVVVEKNLRAVDLCQILAVKNRAGRDFTWSIVEHWIDTNTERVLEDHEDVLAVHRQTHSFNRKFIFRRIPQKYEFFSDPTQFFPREMTKLRRCNAPPIDENALLQTILWHGIEAPMIFSQANYQSLEDIHTWIKKFFVIKGTKILMSADAQVVKRFLRYWRNQATFGYEVLKPETETVDLEAAVGLMREIGPQAGPSGADSPSSSSRQEDLVDLNSGSPPPQRNSLRTALSSSQLKNDQEEERRGEKTDGTDGLELFADLKDFDIYSCVNPQKELGAPAALCLRSTAEQDFSNCLYFAPDSLQDQTCWLTAMRLAKYGKQLRENYKSFKGKQEAVSAPKEIHTDNMRSRVAMDFTGSVGRIVEDPQEAREIAQSEGAYWKKKWKEMMANQPRRYPTPKDEHGAHLNQPWYHENMSRDQAVALLNTLPEKDGIFVVRDSKSKPGCFVLTSKHNGKILHTTIEPLQDKEYEGICDVTYTIDGGATKFIDLYQLVWFHILNTTALPSKLIHWSKH